MPLDAPVTIASGPVCSSTISPSLASGFGVVGYPVRGGLKRRGRFGPAPAGQDREMPDDAGRGAADTDSLDDENDRGELRDRYYGLPQELRVVVTGVQVLLAFLLSVPFAQGFTRLDDTARAWFGAALVSAMLSVIAFVTPTAMHRYGKRTARGDRLSFSIAAARVGLLFLGLAVLLSFAVVVDYLYSGPVAVTLVLVVSVALIGAWLLLPLLTFVIDDDRHERGRPRGGR